MIEKLNKDDLLTLYNFLDNYIEDKQKLVKIYEDLLKIIRQV